jgi:hypothetical protein
MGHCSSVALALLMVALAASAQSITTIRALPDTLVVQPTGARGAARLVELRPYQTYSPDADLPLAWEGRLSGKPLGVPRFVDGRDRLYSKFQLVEAKAGKALGSAHYADDLSGLPAWDFAMPWPEGKKGITCPVGTQDLLDLGVKYVDFGVLVSMVADWGNPNPEATWEVDGQRVGINMGYVRSLDAQIKPMSDAGMNVTLIPVNGVPTEPDPRNPFIHPRTDLAHTPNHLGAFNLTDERGLLAYRAVMEFLAHRYSDPGREHGWVSGYVIGNELQSHWAWHNLGDATAEDVVREYVPALRVAWLAVRRYHSQVRVYISLDHCWTTGSEPDPLHATTGVQVLEGINASVTSEGDFPWHVGFHPYPEDLFQPRFWQDRLALMSFDTPKITFRNLEVLPAYLRQERFLYRGQPRRIILSEQGFHCPDGPDGEQAQAAAYAGAYYKTSHMPEIDALILHRHVDHRAEGGLRLGLWSGKPDGDDPCAPDRKRLIWDVFRAADTAEWEQAFAFALPIIGIADWGEARPRTGRVPARSPLLAEPIAPERLVYDLAAHMDEADTVRWIGWRTNWEAGADGKLRPSIFQHPPGEVGSPDATFTVHLPQVKAGQRLTFRFDTVVTNAQSDGVGFSVIVDGESVFSHEQAPGPPTAHAVALNPWAGRTVRLTLHVDPLGHTAGDWANWIGPVVQVTNDR